MIELMLVYGQLKIQDMLKYMELDVRIVITCILYEDDNHVRFYGPALIKAASVDGVFCCHCVGLSMQKIVYVEQGLRYGIQGTSTILYSTNI